MSEIMGKHYGKKILMPLLAAALAFTAVGCGQSKNSSSAASSSTGPVTIKVWTNNRHDLAYMNSMVEQFNKANPNIQVSYQTQSDNYNQMITMASSSGQLPDLMSIAQSDEIPISDLVNAKIVQALNPYFTSSFTKDTDAEKLKYEQLNVIGSKIYWVPTWLRSGNRLIYNKTLFDQAGISSVPKTLDELVSDTAKITSVGGGKAYGISMPGQSSPWSRFFETAANESGVNYYDYKNGKFDFSGYKPVLEAARKMYQAGSFLPGSSTMKVDAMRVQFSAGNIGLYGNASQEVGVLTSQFPAKMPWGVGVIPTISGKQEGAIPDTVSGGWMMSASSKHAKEAWKVLSYFSSVDVMTGYCNGGFGLPASSAVSAKVDKTKMGRLADFSLQTYEDVYPTVPNVTPAGQTYDVQFWNAVITSSTNLDTMITNLNKAYNDALNTAVQEGKTKRLVIKNYDPLHPSKGTQTYLTK